MSCSKWNEQIEDMDNEDKYHELVRACKIYPNGLFNLVSNPAFQTVSKPRKLRAICDILQHDTSITKKSIFFDSHSNNVYFVTVHKHLHRCDLNNKQVHIIRTRDKI